MATFKVVVTDQVFPSVQVEREVLAEVDAELDVADGTTAGVRALAKDADALLNTYLPIDASLIGSLRRCRIVARYGIGVDNIDLRAASDAGIIVTNVPDYSTEEVAAHALALMLALLRRLPEADRLVREGAWGIDGLRPIHRISELTFGLIGFGRIARRLRVSIEALGAKVVVHDPYVKEADGLPLLPLESLLAQADVVSIHAPLTDRTRSLIDAHRLGLMRPGAILVNTSRGSIVVLSDLIEALRSGRLRAAGLDVFDSEPVDPALIRGVPNLLSTPHVAYYSESSLGESQRKAATQVAKVLTGQPPDYQVGAAPGPESANAR